MVDNVKEEIARTVLNFVDNFFRDLIKDSSNLFPEILRLPGKWMASYTGPVLGIFFLNEKERQRVVNYQKKGWPPFPGLIISKNLLPDDEPVALEVAGTCHYFSSNHTSFLWGFSVHPGTSFAIANHFHEGRDLATGNQFEFHVDLAFILSPQADEGWDVLKPRLSELLSLTLEVWKNS